MDDLFQNQFRIKSSRLPDWDYAVPGLYFVTIGTQDHKHYLGSIKNRKMQLNQAGEIAEKSWIEIPQHHNNVLLDAFVIMPNHIHGILLIVDNEENVETLHTTSLRSESSLDSDFYSKISPKKGSLSTIIRSYKSSITRIIRKNLIPHFAWQSRFYDHIIRTEQDLDNLRQYIALNPENLIAEVIPHA